MAELILAVVALGLAAPGIVVSVQQCTKYLADRISSFRNAPSVLTQLRVFAIDLHHHQLIADLEIAREAFASDACDATLKTSLDQHIKRFAASLLEAAEFVKSINVDNTFQKLWFSAIHERRVKRLNKELGRAQNDLLGVIQILVAQRTLVPDSLKLTDRVLVAIEEAVLVAHSPSLLRARCEYKTSAAEHNVQEIKVLFERFETASELQESHLREIAGHLSRHFKQESPYRGILPCLGYRMAPKPELCFQLPDEVLEIKSLHSIINHDAGLLGPYQRRLEDRFEFARAISEAVLSVAATGFVHKSIRSNTILVLQPNDSNEDRILGTPFLSNWRYLRKTSDLSARVNFQTDWHDNVYRHPQRYDIQPQERYNIGHDIYSLGVCLLEIGIWTTLSVEIGGRSEPSEMFKQSAARYSNVSVDRLDLLSMFKSPAQIQQILVSIAAEQLPGRMGLVYANLVQKCLRCLEGGFGADIDFREMSAIEAQVYFNDEVIEALPRLD